MKSLNEAIKEVNREIRETEAHLRGLKSAKRDLENAKTAIAGEATAKRRVGRERGPDRAKRQPSGATAKKVMEHLRKNQRGTGWTPKELEAAGCGKRNTIVRAVNEHGLRGKVRFDGKWAGHNTPLHYKPVAVRPGEEVKAS